MNKHKLAVFFILAALAISLLPSAIVAQNTSIVPDPPIGKGVVVLKAARLIDGTGKPAAQNGVVVVTDNPAHIGRFVNARDWRSLANPTP